MFYLCGRGSGPIPNCQPCADAPSSRYTYLAVVDDFVKASVHDDVERCLEIFRVLFEPAR